MIVLSILDLADETDVIITSYLAMDFPEGFSGIILDIGKIISTHKEYINEYIDFKHDWKG